MVNNQMLSMLFNALRGGDTSQSDASALGSPAPAAAPDMAPLGQPSLFQALAEQKPKQPDFPVDIAPQDPNNPVVKKLKSLFPSA